MNLENNKTVLILGASSSIARSIASSLAEKGYDLFLAARDEDDLKRISQDLKIRYPVQVNYGSFEAENIFDHQFFFNEVINKCEGLFGVVLAFGYLGDQSKAEKDFTEAEKIIKINYFASCSLLTHSANYLEKQKAGFIVGISSVAGDRGRQSNYVYGSAKAGLTTFLQGLRNRLYPSGVHVMTVKPGFVDTAMTFGKSGLFLVATPEYVGQAIVRSLERSRNEIYVPWFWRIIMFIIRLIPELLFKRLKL